MTIIRNLTSSDVQLDDLGGVTLPALDDYNLSEESHTDIATSQDLTNAINVGAVVFVDSQGVALTQQQSASTQNSISSAFPAFVINVNGTNIGGPFSTINLGENTTATDGNTRANLDFMSNIGISKTTISGQEMMTFTDPNRSNKILSVEKIPFVFTQSTVNAGTYLKITPQITTAGAGYVMPFDGTIVGLSSHVRNPNGRTGTYDVHLDNVAGTPTLITYSGSSEQRVVDNTLDYDIVAGQKLQFRCDSISGGGMNKNQYDINVVVYVRWRG